MTGDEIRLTLPAEAEYARLARAAAAALALRLGFAYPEIEDLRIAMDETLILLLRPEGRAGNITFTFVCGDGELEITARTTAGDDQHYFDAGARSRFDHLVTGLVDEATVDPGDCSVRIVARQG